MKFRDILDFLENGVFFTLNYLDNKVSWKAEKNTIQILGLIATRNSNYFNSFCQVKRKSADLIFLKISVNFYMECNLYVITVTQRN